MRIIVRKSTLTTISSIDRKRNYHGKVKIIAIVIKAVKKNNNNNNYLKSWRCDIQATRVLNLNIKKT